MAHRSGVGSRTAEHAELVVPTALWLAVAGHGSIDLWRLRHEQTSGLLHITPVPIP